jgi:hypothetical protein
VITPLKYQRTSFYVEAVKVTAENMEEVTIWCGGTKHVTPPKHAKPGREAGFVKVTVHNPLAGPTQERQSMAFVDDWVVKGIFGPNGTEGFKVYLPKAFDRGFLRVDEEVCGVTDHTLDHEPCVLAAGHMYGKKRVGCRSFRDYLLS